jgi:3-deoxy-D-manno-octulosonate 8-phosphate phosphatase (KDO 8-P phosphatase)
MPRVRPKDRRAPSRRSPSGSASRAAGGSARRKGTIPIRGPIRIVFLDLDGTLTDGVIGFDTVGDQRNFFIRDGLALAWARDRGVLPVVISGRGSKAAELRMQDLELEHYLDVKDKVQVAERVMARESVGWDQCVMVGDDLPDIAMLKRAGWAVAVSDAVEEVKAVAHWVTSLAAGRGAVREVMERVLKHNGLWQSVLEHYEVT